MSLLSYNELYELVSTDVIDAPIENINGASIDITLGSTILIERTLEEVSHQRRAIDLKAKQSIDMYEHTIAFRSMYKLEPSEFILATTQETFNLPNFIAAEFKLKSSLARNGLQHMLAGWCDPGWNNSKLTLELKNVTNYHHLLLTPGMKIGQMVFFKCDPVPDQFSYKNKGQYNNQETVTANKGLR
tara:strand:+ start:4442 stop:5002 length:561 start_codon:yes stop_codon:yes gene_type:complete